MKRKRQKKSDRISELPDHVLLHIIEFMNIKQSVQTCVLSKRWKSLWKSLANLTLHHSEKQKSYICKWFVSQLLARRDNSLPLHSLSYEYDNAADCNKTTLLEVMEYAVSHNVQQLTVIVKLWTIKDLEFPPSIFNSHSLTFLKLDFYHPSAYDCGKMFPKSLNLPALKTLYLRGLTFTTSNNGCVEPFSTCNMLSTLVIVEWYLQDDAHTLSVSNSNVSSLTIGSAHLCKQAGNFKVVLCTPKLMSLTINGRPIFSAPSACNLPFLEEANINYSQFFYGNEYLIPVSWLQLLANVKILTLGFKTLAMMLMVLRNNDSMRNQLPCFVRLKSFKLDVSDVTISNERIIEMVAYLLQDSPPLVAIDIIRNADLITFRFEVANMMDRAIHLEDNGGGGSNVDYN